MKKIGVSIIVPVLNTVKYVHHCLESIKNQTCKNIEIICVDGGSTDGTLEILEEYAQSDDRFSVVTGVKQSYGKQVNRGIQCAIGEYIAIVEPDDYVAIDMYEVLYNEAMETDADVIRGDYVSFIGEEDDRVFFLRNIAKQEWYGKRISAEQCLDIFDCGPANWSGIYKREFLLNNNIWHNSTEGASFQDLSFSFLTYGLAKDVRFVNVYGYHYRLDNPRSSVYSEKKMNCILKEFEYLDSELQRRMLTDTYKEAVLRQKFIHYLWGFYRVEDGEKNSYLKMISEELKHFINQNKLQFVRLDSNKKKLINQMIDLESSFLEEYRKNKRKILEVLRNNRQTILFGCGTDGINFLLLLKEIGELTKIACIIDNDNRLYGKKILNIDVLSVENGVNLYRNVYYIIASAKYGNQMREQLLNIGVNEEKIIEERMI